jgi:hypothetical protein
MPQNSGMASLPQSAVEPSPAPPRPQARVIVALALVLLLGPALHMAFHGGTQHADCEICVQIARDTGPSPFVAPLRLPGGSHLPPVSDREAPPSAPELYRSGARGPPARFG